MAERDPSDFNLFDFEREGPIDEEDLKVAMKSLGYEYTQENIQELVMKLDPQNKGEIDYQAFFDLLQAKMSEKSPTEQIEMAFETLDIDRTKKISFKNLKTIASALGEEITDQELREMINEADTDNDGEISYEEFIDLVKFATLDEK